jgi:hypothetical protein
MPIVDIQIQMAGLPLSAGWRVRSADFGPRQPGDGVKNVDKALKV